MVDPIDVLRGVEKTPKVVATKEDALTVVGMTVMLADASSEVFCDAFAADVKREDMEVELEEFKVFAIIGGSDAG